MKNNRELTFDDFKNLAENPELSQFEKIGFPNSYRKGKSEAIIADIATKIPLLHTKNKTIIDIGCGCSDLVKDLIKISKKNKHKLILIDSQEMLGLVPNASNVIKFPGYFPDIPELFNKYAGKIDYILTYSVFHYVFTESNIFNFIHKAMDLLRDGGSLLIGDIPNMSKRKRFLQSKDGVKFLQNKVKFDKENMNKVSTPNDLSQKIDDAVILSILTRYRNFGYETYLMPQKDDLPMANRREDILIIKR
jgi:cyclopropane fatty-acyl-phospholipid synthase-like methyltransferase